MVCVSLSISVDSEKEESDSDLEARKAAITKYIKSLPAMTVTMEPAAGEHATLVCSISSMSNIYIYVFYNRSFLGKVKYEWSYRRIQVRICYICTALTIP